MISVFSLWLPVLLSAVAVFLASWVLHNVLSHHKKDVIEIPDEASVADALRPFGIPPGDYVMPHCDDPKEMASPEFIEKTKAGPVAILTVLPNQPFALGKSLLQWFVYAVVVSALTGYVAGIGLGPDASGSDVFRLVSVVAFAGHSLAVFHSSIWWGRQWGYSIRTAADGLVYAVITGALFVWLWP